MKEREINLIDLFVEILLHWRMLIVWMLVGAVLAGLFSYISSSATLKNQQAQNEKMVHLPETLLSEEEMQNVNYTIAYENAYNAQNTYLEESPIMDIDPNHVCKAEATIVIAADDPQTGLIIQDIYKDIVQSSELVAKVAEDVNTETIGMNDVICLAGDSSIFDGLATVGKRKAMNSSEDSNAFRIIVIYNDETQCQNILESTIAFLKEKQPDIENTFGKHDVIIANQSYGVISSTEITTFQKNILTDIATMKRELTTAKTNLSAAEQQYYQLLINNTEITEIIPTESIVEPHLNRKYVLVGAIIGVFLYTFVLFLMYIFNTKIRFTDNLQELYEIPQLGQIPVERKPKSLLLFLRNHNKRRFTPNEALNLSAVAVKMAAGKENLYEITFIGCDLKERSLETCEKIKAQLENDNIQTTILNNVLYDAQAMSHLEQAKGVVLVERVNSTLCIEIANEIELLKRQGIKLLGGILVE